MYYVVYFHTEPKGIAAYFSNEQLLLLALYGNKAHYKKMIVLC